MPPRIRTIVLDHVAVAAERLWDAWPRYAGDLGGAWVGNGETPGFNSAQVSFGNGMKLEVLEPARVDEDDFLRRYLERQGPGPHHLTYRVDDITTALAAAEAAGFRPVGVDFSDPGWKEAFLHPKEALGIVIQLAESKAEYGPPHPPEGFPAPRTPHPATLDRVVYAVSDLDDGLRLFGGLLGGQVQERRDHGGSRSADLAWPGPGRIRLVEPTPGSGPVASWLAGRTGRLHHLAFTVADPGAVADSRPAEDGSFEVAPEHNLGVRLVLRAPE